MQTAKRFAVFVLMVGLMFVVARNTAYADACVSNGTGGGNWSNLSTWSSCSGSAPTTGDSVTILSGDTVVVSTNRQVDSVAINDGGTLEIQSNRLTILSAGNTMTVYGTLVFSGSTAGFLLSDTSAVTLSMGVNGSIKTARTNGSALDPTDINASIRQTSPGSWNLTSIASSGSVEYTATTAQTITDRDYNYLTITNAGTKTWTPGTTRTVNGNLTIDTSAPLTLSGAQTVNIKGTFSNSGTFTAGTGTVIFNGSGTQNLTANNSTTFNNLTVNSGVTLVETVSADNVTVSGTLTNNGVIRKAQTVSGTGTKTFGLAGAYNGANLLVNVTVLGALSNLQVSRTDSHHPNATSAQQTGRYWNISATGSGFTTNLTLPRSNSGAASVCRYSGSGSVWSCVADSSNSNSVTRDNISTLSDWAVGNDAPTVLELTSIRLKLTRTNKVRVLWETGSELNLLGFNLYRKRGAQEWVKLNSEIIPTQSIDLISGARYAFIDKDVKPGKTYRYRLELLYGNAPPAFSEMKKITVP